MKTKLLSFIALFSALLAFTSCLKGNDDEGTTYDDSAITAFSLGTLKYTKHAKTKAGADTIIHTTLNASSYKFYIDQMNREICPMEWMFARHFVRLQPRTAVQWY